jgi:hypothetical protein
MFGGFCFRNLAQTLTTRSEIYGTILNNEQRRAYKLAGLVKGKCKGKVVPAL